LSQQNNLIHIQVCVRNLRSNLSSSQKFWCICRCICH